MKFGSNDDDIRLNVDDEFDSSRPSSAASSSLLLCRICHDEEEEKSSSMESPCACSGTLKFAHRGCIQRWCDEKGSTVCEICLQKFEAGYTVPPMLALLDIAVTIRGSLEVPRLNYESENMRLGGDETENDYPECSPQPERTAVLFRALALIFMFLLLVRHLIVVMSTERGHYPFALATILLLRASGILLPFYFLLRVITAIQKGQRQQQRRLQLLQRREASAMERVEEDELPQHTIEIQ